jgi:hypothetical protein
MGYYTKVSTFIFLSLLACTNKQTITQAVVEHSATAKLLLNKRWMEADVHVVQNPDTAMLDITMQFPSYERDDVLVFFESGTYQYDEGATRYNTLHQQVFVNGRWKVDEREKVLYLTANGSTDKYEILALSDSALVLKLNVVQRTKSYSYALHFKGVVME